MAKQLDPKVGAALKHYFPDLTNEEKIDTCWLLERPESRGGPTWMMKHHWVERLGDAAGVEVNYVDWMAATKDFAACQITASLGQKSVITTGEASSMNSTSPYPVAVAEKRAKDRAILKLLGVHGDLLSDEEMEARQEKEEKVVKIVGETEYSFLDFWNAYGKKRGSKHKCQMKWARLRESDRKLIMQHVPLYVAATPDVEFRKNPESYLNGRVWESEELPQAGGTPAGAQDELTYSAMLYQVDKLGRTTADYRTVKKEDGSTRFVYVSK
jgi:hypothetical protein